MEFENYIKFLPVVALIATIIALFWKRQELNTLKIKNLREEYDFSKEFLKVRKDEEIHPLAKDKAYEVLVGSKFFSFDEVEYILDVSPSSKSLRYYSLGRRYFDSKRFNIDDGVSYKLSYEKDSKRNYIKKIYTLLYFIMMVFAIYPALNILFSQDFSNDAIKDMFFYLFFTLPLFGFFAWMSVDSLNRIECSELLLQSLKMHKEACTLNS